MGLLPTTMNYSPHSPSRLPILFLSLPPFPLLPRSRSIFPYQPIYQSPSLPLLSSLPSLKHQLCHHSGANTQNGLFPSANSKNIPSINGIKTFPSQRRPYFYPSDIHDSMIFSLGRSNWYMDVILPRVISGSARIQKALPTTTPNAPPCSSQRVCDLRLRPSTPVCTGLHSLHVSWF